MQYKRTSTILIVFSLIILLTSPNQSVGQMLSSSSQNLKTESKYMDDSFDPTLKLNTDNSEVNINLEEIKKNQYKMTSKNSKRKMSAGEKTAIYGGIAAAVVATALIIYFATRDKKQNNDNCSSVCLGIGICPSTPPPCN